MLRERIETALRKESGLRLSAAEVAALASAFNINTFSRKKETEPQRKPVAKPEKQEQATAHVRWMIRRDLPRVLEIEAEAFADPWTEEEFIRCLRQRNCIGMVAEVKDVVAGFMVYELHKSYLYVLNFAVACEYQMRGVGRAMLDKLTSKLTRERRNRILLEIKQDNCEGQKFFAACGFKAIASLPEFYPCGTDAYRMELPVDGVPYSKFERTEKTQEPWRDSYKDDGDECYS